MPKNSSSAPKPAPERRAVPPTDDALLLTRAQAARLLACSTMTLIRAEHRGAVHPIRLNPTTKSGRVFYRKRDIVALAGGDDA